jgi:hypothetical protein
MTLTENELIALKTITYSDFYENGRNSICWDFSVYDICPLKGKTRSGVYGSLGNKGLIEVTEKMKTYIIDENGNRVRNPYYFRGEPNFGTIKISEDGYKLLEELNRIDEDGNFLNDL